LEQWADCEFTGQDFRDEDLSRLRTERAVFTECNFSGANLAESEHRGSAFRNCTFERTLLCTGGTTRWRGLNLCSAACWVRSLCNAGCDQ
jgi:uncharacterized protein YjbI with pentapeptide repeats